MPDQESAEITIIGAGVAGIAAAYYLSESQARNICLIDAGQPMSFTSAQSGDNYRNWWPHETMTRFTDHSIDLLEEIRDRSGNRINMHQGGYLLATRKKNIDDLVGQLFRGYGPASDSLVRVHRGNGDAYVDSFASAATGVDIINREVIAKVWPGLDQRVSSVLHIRRAGDIDGQQMGQYMLETSRQRGTRLIKGLVTGIDSGQGFTTHLDNGTTIQSERLVCAAGPFINQVLAYIGETVPVINLLQQKLAFEDVFGAVPRDQPFAVDLDSRRLDWTAEELELLESDNDFRWMAGELPGGTHCRPEGGTGGKWVKLGWAINETATEPAWTPPLDDFFPEVVLRGAAQLVPALKQYYDRLPSRRSHYGGYYTMTEENWPLIGPLKTPGAYVIGALSGFGSMAACAAGSLCAKWITGEDLPSWAEDLSLSRLGDEPLMTELKILGEKGSL